MARALSTSKAILRYSVQVRPESAQRASEIGRYANEARLK